MWVEKNGPTFRIRDLVGGKKVTIKAGFPTKTSASTAMILAEADAIRGEQLVPGGGRMSLGEWVEAWYPSYRAGLKPSGQISSEVMLRLHIVGELGHLPIEDIDQLVVQRWLATLLRGRPGRKALSSKSVRNNHGMLHTVMGAAVKQRLIRANPCTDSVLPERVDFEMRFLTEPEAGRLLAAAPEHWRPLVAVLLGTGLRWGEAIGLKVKTVDLLAGHLRVVEQLQELPTTAEMVWVSPKSRMARRTVPLPAYVKDALVPLVAGRDRDAAVFTAVRGGLVRYRHFGAKVWRPLTIRAGLQGLRIHDLRHTHAAWLISAGRPLTAIQRRLGHASIAVTSDRYGHLLPEVDVGIIEALDLALPALGDRGTVGEFSTDQYGAALTNTDERAGQTR
jgi:integrase